jgi:hypothetical protein
MSIRRPAVTSPKIADPLASEAVPRVRGGSALSVAPSVGLACRSVNSQRKPLK